MATQKGKYVYRVDGDILVEEPWAVTVENDGTRQIIASRISPKYNVHISLEAIETEALKTYAFTFLKIVEDEITAGGWYRIEDGKLFYRAAKSMDWREEELGDRLFFPLMRVFTGQFMRDVIERGGEAEAIIPYIEDPSQVSKLFSPTLSTRKVWPHETEALAHKYIGGHYTKPVNVWTGEDGIMTQYVWKPETGPAWECTLEDYQTSLK